MQSIREGLLDVVNVLASKRVQHSLNIVVREYCDRHIGFGDLEFECRKNKLISVKSGGSVVYIRVEARQDICYHWSPAKTRSVV